jgi:glycosyltransferase involved in cell wall biosynthesis
MKKRLLYYGEGPMNMTGFSKVNRHLTLALSEIAHVEYVATSHYHEPKGNEPYKIHTCPDGQTNEGMRNLVCIMDRLKSLEWDIFFYQGDLGANDDVLWEAIRIKNAYPSEKTIIYYIPLDVDFLIPVAFDVMRHCDVAVIYTEQGVRVVERFLPECIGKVSAIGLGTQPDVFYPFTQEERLAVRKKIFFVQDDTFIVINVNRNQARKDIARSMSLFHMFHEKYPHSLFYVHAINDDFGGNLIMQALLAGCKIDVTPPEIVFSSLSASSPWPEQNLNELYNAADCLISTAYGEGWGICTTEALCAELPVLVPGNTANFDIVGHNEERGYLARTGGDIDHIQFLYGASNGIPHDIVHADDFIAKLEEIYLNRNDARKKAFYGRQWALENTWKVQCEKWKQLILLLSG